MATQNPIEQEGTYPLPEAQMDRFMMHVMIGYPDEESEAKIIRLVRGETSAAAKPEQQEAISQDVIFEARAEIDKVSTNEAIEKYLVDLIFATRYPERYSDELKSWIRIGASPRGGLALDKGSRVHAWLDERDYVTPDDVRAIAHNCLRHRLQLSYEARADGVSNDDVVSEVIKQVAVP
jgi:MoxR-like ATPase